MFKTKHFAVLISGKSEAKDQFYAEVQKVVESVGRRETLIVMGDLNAIVGRNTEVWGSVLGCHGEDTRNESGERLFQVLFSE